MCETAIRQNQNRWEKGVSSMRHRMIVQNRARFTSDCHSAFNTDNMESLNRTDKNNAEQIFTKQK